MQQITKKRSHNFLLLCILLSQFAYTQKDSILDFGQRLVDEHQYKEAIVYFEQQLEQAKDSKLETEALLGLADVYKLQLNYSKANDYYHQAFGMIKENKLYQLEFLYYVKMTEFYRKRTLYKEAGSQLEQARLLLLKHAIDEDKLAKYYNRKAALFTEYYHNPDSTLFYANQSLKLARRLNDKDNIFYSTLEIACVYERRKEYKKAIRSFEELLAYSNKNNLIQHHADAFIAYTNVLIKDNQVDKALSESLKGLAFAQKHHLLYNENILTINVYELYQRTKQFEKANRYMERRLVLNEKFYALAHDKVLFELEERYKLSEKENQIKINRLELESKKEELAVNSIRFYVLSGFFIGALLIVLLIAYFFRKTKKSNRQLRFLSQQNAFLLSETNHRINNNLQLIIILISVQLEKVPENEGEELRKVLKKISSIATLHRHLYQSKDKQTVDSHKYLKDIQISFSDLFSENNITADFEIEPIPLSADISMYMGLLLTELCINSIKHAFAQQEHKAIVFKLSRHDGVFRFYYADNGSGLPTGKANPKLIDQLCRQMRVSYTLGNQKGFCLSFEKEIH